jgi:hypothetical protein
LACGEVRRWTWEVVEVVLGLWKLLVEAAEAEYLLCLLLASSASLREKIVASLWRMYASLYSLSILENIW